MSKTSTKQAQWQKNYSRTINGVIQSMYDSQKWGSKKRGHQMPAYTKEELSEWLHNETNFLSLYSKWVDSGYLKKIKPSVDRKNDYVHYCLENIQLMTWEENKAKGHSDRKNCINLKVSKSVIQYSLSGEFICEYKSMQEAKRQTGVNTGGISFSCRGKTSHAGGYVWEYS